MISFAPYEDGHESRRPQKEPRVYTPEIHEYLSRHADYVKEEGEGAGGGYKGEIKIFLASKENVARVVVIERVGSVTFICKTPSPSEFLENFKTWCRGQIHHARIRLSKSW